MSPGGSQQTGFVSSRPSSIIPFPAVEKDLCFSPKLDRGSQSHLGLSHKAQD